ncbi:hypothetical protein GW17_00011684 [Ensete ventricosum]|nr:hypothetical protein GW17_00011684 [Ensete ventricosum]RZR82801.1 hypothetical protein BHM03_00009315 [Ensete ventricosum]
MGIERITYLRAPSPSAPSPRLLVGSRNLPNNSKRRTTRSSPSSNRNEQTHKSRPHFKNHTRIKNRKQRKREEAKYRIKRITHTSALDLGRLRVRPWLLLVRWIHGTASGSRRRLVSGMTPL